MNMKPWIRRGLRSTGWDVVRYSSGPTTPVRIRKEGTLTVPMICTAASEYADSLRVTRHGKLAGYKFARSCERESLYGTVGCVLLKHLLSFKKNEVQEELDLIKTAQREDGLFYDPGIDTPSAWKEDWWGYRHLTLQCVAALALYEEACRYPLDRFEVFSWNDRWIEFIGQFDWGPRIAFTSNALQNYGVFLQYARDFQGSSRAGKLFDVLIEQLDRRIDEPTGLWGRLDFLACAPPGIP